MSKAFENPLDNVELSKQQPIDYNRLALPANQDLAIDVSLPKITDWLQQHNYQQYYAILDERLDAILINKIWLACYEQFKDAVLSFLAIIEFFDLTEKATFNKLDHVAQNKIRQQISERLHVRLGATVLSDKLYQQGFRLPLL